MGMPVSFFPGDFDDGCSAGYIEFPKAGLTEPAKTTDQMGNTFPEICAVPNGKSYHFQSLAMRAGVVVEDIPEPEPNPPGADSTADFAEAKRAGFYNSVFITTFCAKDGCPFVRIRPGNWGDNFLGFLKAFHSRRFLS